MAISQAGRLINLATPLGADFLLLERMRAVEGLSTLYRCDLELVHEETEGTRPTVVAADSILGKPVAVSVKQRDNAQRYFTGIVTEFTQLQRDARFTYYRAVVKPQVWLLTQTVTSRIFQNISVPDILRKVFAGFNVGYELQGTFEPRNYCVQYHETSWDFASRLMEEEGIFYYFEHTDTTHKMVVANTPQSHLDCLSKAKLPFDEEALREDDFVGIVSKWSVEHRLLTGKYTTWDHNFELPNKKLEAAQPSRFAHGGNDQLEIYDYPGGYARRFDGIDATGGEQPASLNKIFTDNKRTVEIRQQEIDAGCRTSSGTSDCCALTAGYRFELINHPIAQNNGKQVLVKIEHQVTQSPGYETDQEVEHAYINNFECIAHGGGHAPYRPPRVTPKPVVRGSQTATVVGPAGEEIFTDKYGRVKVQFHWDREGQADATSSCWIRTAHKIAGHNWGEIHIPRVGQEVIVDFLEGDPDRPIITGSVYNPEQMPPYTLPDEKTKTVLFKSLSSKGGGGFNEIRIEDKKGAEQVFVHGEKNLDVRIKKDSLEWIGRDRHLIIKENQYEKVEKDKHLKVTGDRNEQVDGSVSLKVGTDIDQKAGTKFAVDAGTEIHLKSGTSLTIETGASLTLKVGGNSIAINSSGIYIKGSMVYINSMAAAGSGSGANPDPPKDPKEADKAEPGSLAPPAPKPPPLRPAAFSPAAQVLIRAASEATPFCEVCSRT